MCTAINANKSFLRCSDTYQICFVLNHRLAERRQVLCAFWARLILLKVNGVG